MNDAPYIATICAWVHPGGEPWFTWEVLISKYRTPYVCRIKAMTRYRYKSKELAAAAAIRTIKKLMPGIEIKD